jgi:hypothetical protein
MAQIVYVEELRDGEGVAYLGHLFASLVAEVGARRVKLGEPDESLRAFDEGDEMIAVYHRLAEGKEKPRVEAILWDDDERRQLEQETAELTEEEAENLRLRYEATVLMDEAAAVVQRLQAEKMANRRQYPPERERKILNALEEFRKTGVAEETLDASRTRSTGAARAATGCTGARTCSTRAAKCRSSTTSRARPGTTSGRCETSRSFTRASPRRCRSQRPRAASSSSATRNPSPARTTDCFRSSTSPRPTSRT